MDQSPKTPDSQENSDSKKTPNSRKRRGSESSNSGDESRKKILKGQIQKESESDISQSSGGDSTEKRVLDLTRGQSVKLNQGDTIDITRQLFTKSDASTSEVSQISGGVQQNLIDQKKLSDTLDEVVQYLQDEQEHAKKRI